MQLLAHRGFWNKSIKANSWQSFENAFKNGFGIETDFRDLNGDLVISHDPATADNIIQAGDFFKLAAQYPLQTLAVNIKADGLQEMLKHFIEENSLSSYFVFDASIPDLYRYQLQGTKYFARLSDLEPSADLLDNAEGVWLDAFLGEWFTEDIIIGLLDSGKKVAVVSPELHRRSHEKSWKMLKAVKTHPQYNQLLLCTDFPDEAKNYFDL